MRARHSRRPAITVSEERGVRMLHLGGEHIQSAMRISDPYALELDYTRCMMAFLLFHPQPRECLMIGLGGGSIAKFIHRNLRAVRTRAVELNPAVVTAAHSLFNVPGDDARLSVELGDGALVVRALSGGCDLLFADGFEDGTQVDALTSEDFYSDAWDALAEPGVLVTNFFGADRKLDFYLRRVEAAFAGRVVCLEARTDGNVIAFALKGGPDEFSWDDLRERAARLQERYGLPFNRYVASLRRMNPHTASHLLVAVQ
ncbi:MAG: spermidine synthase [Betaproteobacteria bacterium]|nr:spermidine synthase [Betaproteobacteria bacterium]